MTDDYTFDADLAIADTEIERLRSENKSLKEENALQQTTIKGFMAALDLVNEKCADLKQTIADRDREIVDLNLALECVKKNNLSRKAQLEERDRQIQDLGDRVNCLTTLTTRLESEKAALKHELNDARLLRLEQLEAIVDMLQPLADNKVGWVNDWSVGALKLAIAVIQNNIDERSY